MSDEQRYTRDKNACNTWIIKWYRLDNYFHHLYTKENGFLEKCVVCRFFVAEIEKFERRNFFEDTKVKKFRTSSHEIMINWNANMNSWSVLVDMNYITINKGYFIVFHDFFSNALQYFAKKSYFSCGGIIEILKLDNITNNLPQWEQQELVSSYLLGSSTRFLAFDLRQLQHKIICNFNCLLMCCNLHMCNCGIYPFLTYDDSKWVESTC